MLGDTWELLSILRVALLCLATTALGGCWVIEQPSSSLLFESWPMQHICGLIRVLCLKSSSFFDMLPLSLYACIYTYIYIDLYISLYLRKCAVLGRLDS